VEAANVPVSTQLLSYTTQLDWSTPSKALFNRSIRTILPENKEALKSDRTMREAHARAKSRIKQYADKRAKVKSSSLQPVDIVMLKQRRTNTYSTPYQPIAYEVVARQGPMTTASNEQHVKPPIESDMMEDHSMNNDVPIEVSEAQLLNVQLNNLDIYLCPPGTNNPFG